MKTLLRILNSRFVDELIIYSVLILVAIGLVAIVFRTAGLF